MSIGDRLKAARTKAGYNSAKSAAEAFGWPPSTYASHENGQTEIPPLKALERYARAFKTTVGSLLEQETDRALVTKGNGQERAATIPQVPVRGIAQAGSWRAYEDIDYSELPPVPTFPGRYPTSQQFALKVAGNSANKLRIFDGDFVICVNYWVARTGPVDGDVVAVERRRGTEFERTIKRLKTVDGGFELNPESDDPRHQSIFVPKNHNFHEGEGIEIEIIGLVIGRWSPM